MNFVHLVCVTSQNNNKYYDMRENADGTFTATYGRIGVTETEKVYPMSRWNSTYNQKIGKGYVDKTDNVRTTKLVKTEVEYKPIDDPDIRGVVEFLMSKARDTVKKNYEIEASAVTPQMIAKAQSIIDRLINIPGSAYVSNFNTLLLELFQTIPRRMAKVQDYLADSAYDYEKIVRREQDLLDVMASQVTKDSVTVEHAGDGSVTALDAFGLTFTPVTDKDVEIIKKNLGKECESLYYKAWRVENKKTRDAFKAFTAGKGRITKKLLWHGSRTENWWGILRSGLVLRPANVVINGKMFGSGLYFATRAKKSVGYTSLHGSYWAGGDSRFGFMALCDVVYGKPYNVSDNRGCHDMTYEKLQRVAPGCSSLHAHAGSVLRNDEIIVYREDQVTIKYLVELKA